MSQATDARRIDFKNRLAFFARRSCASRQKAPFGHSSMHIRRLASDGIDPTGHAGALELLSYPAQPNFAFASISAGSYVTVGESHHLASLTPDLAAGY